MNSAKASLLDNESAGQAGQLRTQSGWNDLMLTSRDEANTADPAQRGPAEFVSGGGSALPVLREIGREIRAQRANVRSRSKAQRQAAGLAGGAPPVLRKVKTRRECCTLFGCSSQIVRRKGTRQIVGYSTDAVTTLACFRLSGTVLASRFVWVQSVLLLLLSLGILLIGRMCNGCMYGLSLKDFGVMVTFLNGLCTFLLSLFISLTLARWWALRYNCLGELWNCATELTTLASAYLSDTAEKREVRDKLVRYGLLSHALVFKQAQGVVETETDSEFVRNLCSDGLLLPEEAECLVGVALKPEAPWVWAFTLIAREVEKGTLDAGLRYDFHLRCLRGRTAVSNIFVYIHTKLPLLYVHLIVILVKFTSILWAVQTGITLDQAFNDNNKDTDPRNIGTTLMLQFFVPLIYQAALELHRKLHNPFLSHSAGFPEATFQSAIECQCDDIVAASEAMGSWGAGTSGRIDIAEGDGEFKAGGAGEMESGGGGQGGDTGGGGEAV